MVAPLIMGAMALAAEFAPMLIRQFAGDNAGDVADKVAGAAKVITGETDPAAQMAALQADKELAAAFRGKMADLEIGLARIDAADRDSARDMQQKLASQGHATAWSPALLSAIILIGFTLMLYAVTQNQLPEGNAEITYVMLGTLGALATQVANFWLGSSHGSKMKTELMGRH